VLAALVSVTAFATAARADVATLSRHIVLTGDQPGWVEVSIPTRVELEAQSNNDEQDLYAITLSGSGRLQGLGLMSEQAYSAGPPVMVHDQGFGFVNMTETPHPRGNTTLGAGGHLDPGLYRLYLFTTPGVAVRADMTFDALPLGETVVSPTNSIPVDFGDDPGLPVADSTHRIEIGRVGHLNSPGLLWETWSDSWPGAATVGWEEDCGAQTSDPSAGWAGCPSDHNHAPSPWPESGSYSAKRMMAVCAGTIQMGWDAYNYTGPPPQLSAAAGLIGLNVPDDWMTTGFRTCAGRDLLTGSTAPAPGAPARPAPVHPPAVPRLAVGLRTDLVHLRAARVVVPVRCLNTVVCQGSATIHPGGRSVRLSVPAGASTRLQIPLTRLMWGRLSHGLRAVTKLVVELRQGASASTSTRRLVLQRVR
jgi:hypothetical protein